LQEKTAHFLIATVFMTVSSGLRGSIHKESTNLSTDICGYREIHYNGSLRNHAAGHIDAARKLAGLQEFA
jgi:hypothetical protein